MNLRHKGSCVSFCEQNRLEHLTAGAWLRTRREPLAPGDTRARRAEATSKFIDINGLKLHYIDYGSEGLPRLILLHGLNGNAHAFVWSPPI